jgi:hypothetical protein
MKRFAVLALVTLAVALVASGTAGARTQALTPAEKNLQNQVNALSKKVTTLQKSVTALNKKVNDVGGLAQAAVFLDECSNAVTADALQGTWNVIDQIATATQAGKTYFGPQTPIDDKGICALFGISRSQVSPPTVAPYNALIGLVAGTSALSKRIAL